MSEDKSAAPSGEAPQVSMQIEPYLPELYVVADMPRPAESVLEEKHGITWYNLGGCTLAELETRISLLLDSTTPVHVVSVAHQQHLVDNLSEEVFQTVINMHEKAVKSQIHKFSCGSCVFTPDLYAHWQEFALFNKKLRQLAIDSSTQPLYCHKPLLERQRNHTVMCVNPTLYVEFLAGSSMGLTLTRDGQKKFVSPIVKHLMIGMKCTNPLVARNDPASLTPTPPGCTVKFLRSQSVVEYMRNCGLFVATNPKKGARSLSRPRVSEPKRRRHLPEPPARRPPAVLPPGMIPVRVSSSSGSSSGVSSGEPRASGSSRSSRSSAESMPSGSGRYSRASGSSLSSAGARSSSESSTAAIAAERRANDLMDTVFLNALNDPSSEDNPASMSGDQTERFHAMWNAYGRLATQNFAQKNEIRELNLQLIELQRFKLKTLNQKPVKLEKELDSYKYHLSRTEHEVRMVRKQLATEKSECNRIIQDYYDMRQARDDLKKELDELRDSRAELARLYDNLVEDTNEKSTEKKKKKGKARKQEN